MTRIGILAGGGRLPLTIAESATARGETVHIVGIEGEADKAIAAFPHTWVNWGQIGRMVETLRREGGERMVIAGGVARPDLWRLRPDRGFFRNLPYIMRLLVGGDDSVLSRVVRFFERNGLHVVGVHEVAPDLLAGAGRMGTIPLGAADLADAELGFAVRRALAPVDAGQAVVVIRGKVLAIEGAEGTDAMLQRVAALAPPDSGAAPSGGPVGVLAKGPKPGQELRVDMPAIGPRTVEHAVAAGLAAVVVEADAVLVLDRPRAVAMADTRGCALHGLAGIAAQPAARGGVGPPSRVGRVVGRVRPGRRDAEDIERGLATVECLAPFATGRGAVVVRHFVRAIEAAEGAAAMLERAASLRRQWGLAWRKVGVFVRRADEADAYDGALADLFEKASAQGLAGIAVTGPAHALAAYEDAGRLADDLGLFLVLCEAA
jgi:lipid-A-disaccharide synthase